MKHLCLAAAAMTLATTAACGFDPAGVAPPLSTRLAQRAHLPVIAGSDLSATAIAGPRQLAVGPVIEHGEVVVRTTADGFLLVEDLTLALGDVAVPPGFIDERGFTATELVLHLGTQVAISLPADHPTRARLAGSGRGDLILEWAARDADGRTWPLGPRRAPRLQFDVAVATGTDGALEAQVSTWVAGPAVAVPGVVALTDLDLQVVAAEPAATLPAE
ncbi:MAG: hypothetical protein R3B06_07000 [Kofleriaceae bacterium]